ncbi:MAG: family 20 glycosylhydrolase, partial [Akkermansia sp.]
PFTLESVYTFNLYPDKLTEKGRKNVYGAQAQLWNELMPKSEFIEYQAFPRAAALAELTWTPENRKDYKDFYKRLINHGKVLDAYNVNYRYINPLP